MRTHNIKHSQYLGLAMLAALLVTGVPGESSAVDADLHDPERDILNCSEFDGGRCSPPGLIVHCKRTGSNGEQQVCHVQCNRNGAWTSPYACGRPRQTSEGSNSAIPAELELDDRGLPGTF